MMLRVLIADFIEKHDKGKLGNPNVIWCDGHCEPLKVLRAALQGDADAPVGGLRQRIEALVSDWSDDDAALWREQVPYLVRTEVVDRLREALDDE